jgi:hypothetical protein
MDTLLATAPSITCIGLAAEPIRDIRQLFVYSGMCDQVRDTAAMFITNGVDCREALSSQTRMYLSLRSRLADTLDDAAADDLDTWAPALDPWTTSAAALHATTATLSRYLDLLHQMPQFVVQHRVLTTNTQRMSDELDAGASTADAETSTTVAGVPSAGLYL